MKRWLIALTVSLGLLAPAAAFWQSRDSNYNVAVGSSAATQTFESFVTEASGGSSITYSSVALGATTSKQVIAVIAMCRTAGATTATVSSVTVGGNAATHVSSSAASLNNSGSTDIWYYADAGALGASANIVVTWSNTTTRTGIYVYNITTSTLTPSNGNSVTGLSTTSVGPTTLTVPSNGVGISGLYTQQTGNTQSFTNASLDSSNAMSGGNGTASGHTTATGSVSVTGVSITTANGMAMSLASWGT